jgi:Catalytic LigB subunit of aromatic ring-opening dioxygenase
MARLVAAFGSSHSIMLVAQRADWMHGFREADRHNNHLYDRAGRKTDYASLLAGVPVGAAERLAAPEVLSARFDAAHAAMDRIAAAIAAARLDVLIIVGDDQSELFSTRNNPAIAVYHGAIIRNTARAPAQPGDPWMKSARMWRHEPEVDRQYPVAAEFGHWLTRQLCDRDFDIAALDGLDAGQCEGHAFQFVHRRLLGREGAPMLPVLPVILNTFDPPNQPTPRRCVALGHALRELIAEWPGSQRIGAIASGGLSHFVVDEALDQRVLRGMRDRDFDDLAALDPLQLQAGSSEIRNWLVVGALASELEFDAVDYIPAYRSEALTGTGLAFATWKPLA